MQASNGWVPPSGTLGEILEETRKRVTSIDRMSPPRGTSSPLLPDSPRPAMKRPSLKAALRRDNVAVIAEVKRRSPSKGTINGALSAAVLARLYQNGGAAAVSILTEPARFGGSLQDLRDAAAATHLPLLKKDFHISVWQLPEAFEAQASAILLIARALPPQELLTLMARTREAGMETVIEVRSESELDLALTGGAEIIGVNSRDLETLHVDERVPERLMPMIPPTVIGIWESGVQNSDGVRRAADCGADAVLVGSALSRAEDPEGLLRTLTSVARKSRDG